MTTRSSFGLLTALALLAGPAACTVATEGTAPTPHEDTGSGGSPSTTTSSGIGGQGAGDTTCTPGSTLACYSGAAGTEGKGACKGGLETCDADGAGFGACEGEVAPSVEDCSNRIDDDCNGLVDDNCPCTPGEVDACYSGPADTKGVGVCVSGTHTCNADGMSWSACMGEVLPAIEDCATAADEDCDGHAFDDTDSGCVCEPSTAAPCDTMKSGVCSSGTKTCDPTGTSYAACAQTTQPSFDDCVTPDDEDCDGASVTCTGNVESAQGSGAGTDDGLFAVDVDAMGNVLVGGVSSTQFATNGYDASGSGSFALRKFASNGSLAWEHVIAPTGNGAKLAIVRGVAADAAGNVFAVGTVSGTIDFGGGLLASSSGSVDIFVVKYAPNGTHLWSEIFGDGAEQDATRCAVDANGNVYLTGGFSGTFTFGGTNMTTPNYDVFVASLDANGAFRWQKRAGDASWNQVGWDIAASPDGNVVVAGHFAGKVDFGGQSLSSVGGSDVFVAKLSQADGTRVWSKAFGDDADQTAYALAVDPQGHIALTGRFDGVLDFGAGAMTSAGSTDAYVARLAADGSGSWSVRAGDAGDAQEGDGIALDPAGNVVVTGRFRGAADFGGVLTSSGGYDVFVAKFDGDGNSLWRKSFGSQAAPTADQVGWDVALDSKADAFVVGDYETNLVVGAQTLTSAGGWDAFLAKLSP